MQHRPIILLFLALLLPPAVGAAELLVGPGEAYTTIQAAVDAAAASGDTITVAAGTFTEQVLIVGKELTLRGTGTADTRLVAPVTLASLYNDGSDHFPVLGIQDATVDLVDLTVDGDGQGNLHEPFYGVLWRNAGGSLTDVDITGVRNEPLDTAPHGMGLAVRNDDTLSRSFELTGGSIDQCQQAGLDLRTAADTPLAVSLASLSVTAAAGDADGVGIYLEGCTGTTTGLEVNSCFLALHLAGSPVTVSASQFVADLSVADPAASVGLRVENLEGHADLDLAAAGNTFTGFGSAMVLRDNATTVGTWLSADVSDNTINTCPVGLDTDLSLTVLAEQNWWGALDGPSEDGPGSGVALVGTADVDPWRTDVLNLVGDPDPLALSETAPVAAMTWRYEGGASGRVYGFSIDLEWDPALVTASASDIDRAAAGPFAAASYFLVQDIAPGHVRIDLAMGSGAPGFYAGDLFEAAFTLAPTAPHAAPGAITPTILSLRDNQNHPLAGLVPSPAALAIDSLPALADLTVTNTTLGSTEWLGDGQDISVSVNLVESSLDSLRCDLVAFGGPILELGDATVDGDTYTWTLAGVSGTGDGPVSAVITAVDTQAASSVISGAITADNTPPAALASLVATPGHEKIHLSWDEPAADAGSPMSGLYFRYVTWGNYPAYAGPLPDGPADVLDGLDPGLGLQTGTAVDWAVIPREVYVVGGFVSDLVGNVSAAGTAAAATNYWLGDYNGDGLVDVFDDLTALGDSYGKAVGEPGYDAVCDVGPTMDWSPRGIPVPETDGYQVQFEDLMVTALNHDEVSPEQKTLPVAPELRWEQRDEVTWTLVLASPCPDLRGLHLRGTLPAEVTCSVAAGPLLSQQATPVFLRNIASRGLDTGVAAMGPGARLEGAGDVLTVTTSAPLKGWNVLLQARDSINRELLDDQGTTPAPVPSAQRLDQNIPNPFNPSTTIGFALPQAGPVQLNVYSVSGRLVRTLLDEVRPAGEHAVTWNGRDDQGRQVATGSYFYVLRASDQRQVRKMTLLK